MPILSLLPSQATRLHLNDLEWIFLFFSPFDWRQATILIITFLMHLTWCASECVMEGGKFSFCTRISKGKKKRVQLILLQPSIGSWLLFQYCEEKAFWNEQHDRNWIIPRRMATVASVATEILFSLPFVDWRACVLQVFHFIHYLLHILPLILSWKKTAKHTHTQRERERERSNYEAISSDINRQFFFWAVNNFLSVCLKNIEVTNGEHTHTKKNTSPRWCLASLPLLAEPVFEVINF